MFDQTTTWRVEAFEATRNRLEIRFLEPATAKRYM